MKKTITIEEYKTTRKKLFNAIQKLDADFFAQYAEEIENYDKRLEVLFGNTQIYEKVHEAPRRGIPSKQDVITEWRLKNPKGTMEQCHYDTRVSLLTVKKWWQKADVIFKKTANTV